MKLGPENPTIDSREMAKKQKEEKYLEEQMQKKLSYSKKSFIDSVEEARKKGKKFNEAFMAVLKSAGRLKDYDQIAKPIRSPLEEKLRHNIASELGKRSASRKETLKREEAAKDQIFTPQELRRIERGAQLKEFQDTRREQCLGLGSKRITPRLEEKRKAKTKKDDKQFDLFT
jgi:hypothetical protein